MIIAVDFDGTIANTSFPDIHSIVPEAKIYIHRWRKMGHKVVLWTCREGEYLTQAVNFCLENGIKFDTINDNINTFFGNNSRKLYADFYIDDRTPSPVLEQWKMVNERLRK